MAVGIYSVPKGPSAVAGQIRRQWQSSTLVGIAIIAFGAGCLVGAWGASSYYHQRLGAAVRREVAIALFERLDGDFYLLDKAFKTRVWSNAPIGPVDLRATLVQDRDLKLLEGTSGIVAVDLRGTAISDVGLMSLATLPGLAVVDVRQTAVSKDAVEQFKKIRPDCEIDWDEHN
jgi:hypothetical protein